MYVNLVNDFDEPQLFVAVSFGKVEFVTALLAYADVTVNAIDNSVNTLLWLLAAHIPNREESVSLLTQHDASPETSAT